MRKETTDQHYTSQPPLTGDGPLIAMEIWA